MLLAVAALSLLVSGDRLAIVAVNPPPPPAVVRALARAESAAGHIVQSGRAVARQFPRLAPAPLASDEAWSSLKQARALEARWREGEAAAARAHVIATCDGPETPTDSTSRACAAALHDAVAAALSKGDAAAAATLGRRAARQFADLAGDAAILPPTVMAHLQRCTAVVAKEERATLLVRGTGVVWLDGRPLGVVAGARRFSVPMGVHRVWMIDARAPAQVATVEVARGSAAVHFFSGAPPRDDAFACLRDCEPLLGRAAEFLGVDRIIGISAEADALILREVRRGGSARALRVRRDPPGAMLPVPTDGLAEAATQALEGGDAAEAQSLLLQALLQTRGMTPASGLALARWYLSRGLLGDAIETLTELTAQFPGFTDAHLLHVLALERSGAGLDAFALAWSRNVSVR